MTDQRLGLHAQRFNEKVKVMNQARSKDLVLSAVEAQNLHSEIFMLLATITSLTAKLEQQDSTVTDVIVTGGKF